MNIKKFLVGTATGALMLGALVVPVFASDTYNVSDQTGLETAITTATTGDTIELVNSFTVGHRVSVNKSITIDGNGFTISPTFTKNGDNNATLGIFGSNVTIKDLTINGTGGTNLHGINIYVATNILLDNVTVTDNDRTGVVVNGSTVTVNNITTSGNGWHGINVDQGGGVTTPAILTITGFSSQDDALQIYVDDTLKGVSVIDTLSQYTFQHINLQGTHPNDRLYTLIGAPVSKDECKKGGWMTFVNPSFSNQGACVSYVVSNDHAGKK